MFPPFSLCIPVILILILTAGCSTSREFPAVEELSRADINAGDLIRLVPDYRNELHTISGQGRAIVSEPGNSERVTVRFHSNRKESLITVRNSVGIEGGQIYVDRDSLLIYNRIDKVAEKVPLHEGRLSSVGSIASVNILDLLNYTLDAGNIDTIHEDSDFYYVITDNRSRIKISKDNARIEQVLHAADNRTAPYSRIDYDGYTRIQDFILPRRITIFSKDEASRATLLVQRLDVNTELPELTITIPDDIPIQRL